MSNSKKHTKIVIGFFGNTGNGLFHIARALAKTNQFEIHFFLNKKMSHISNPLSDVPEVKDIFFHYGRWLNPYIPRFSKLIRRIRSYQISTILVSDVGPMISLYTKIPVLFFPAGWDFTMLPFKKSLQIVTDSKEKKYGRYSFLFSFSIKKTIFLFNRKILSYNQRKGLRNCHSVIGPNDVPFVESFEKLNLQSYGVSNLLFKSYLAIDTDLFTPRASTELSVKIREIKNNYDFIIFHPSRFLINCSDDLIEAGQWKGNDIFLKGFANALPIINKKYSRVILILLDLSESFSPDINLAKKIISQLNLDQNVLWLKPFKSDVFTRRELAELYSIAHVTADDFGVGWWGSVVLEALASSSLVVSKFNINQEVYLNDDFPVYNAGSDLEISNVLTSIAENYLNLNEKKIEARLWVLRNHSYSAISDYVTPIILSSLR